jgi:copper homeostasis protein (lipoprotein)
MKSIFKIYLIAAIGLVAAVSCKSTQKQQVGNDDPAGAIIPDHHTSRTSLDWWGTYWGVLPCADCEGIRTTLILQDDHNYVLKSFYIGRSEQEDIQQGTFTWNDAGSAISLAENGGDAVQLLVGENRLFILDQEGNRITGDLADFYTLNRMPAEIGMMLETQWVLTDLTGLSTVKSGLTGEAPTLMFDQLQSRVSGFAGCNRYFGAFRISADGGIRISNIGSTKMACDDMRLERDFLAALENVDRFEVKDDQLFLSNSASSERMIFEAAPND